MTITHTWEEPHSELSTMHMGLRSGIFLGLSIRSLTDPPLGQHDRSPSVEVSYKSLTPQGDAHEGKEIASLDFPFATQVD